VPIQGVAPAAALLATFGVATGAFEVALVAAIGETGGAMAEARKGGVVCAAGIVFMAEEVDLGGAVMAVLSLEPTPITRHVLSPAAFATAPAGTPAAPLEAPIPIPDTAPDEAAGS
jgi:hypothetical protein